MRMRTLDRRVHLLLDGPRHTKVLIEAKRRNVSVAEVIRDAIDRLPTEADVRRAAIDRILAAEPMAVPFDPKDLRRELDHEHERHERRA
jgi:Arc/MetJ-type ribon-helix-helix transcriptional regulator